MKKLLIIFIVGITLIGVTLLFLNKEQILGADLRMFTVPQGGTGGATFTAGQCLVGNGTGAFTSVACGGGSSWTSASHYGETVFTTNTPLWIQDNTYVSGTTYSAGLEVTGTSATTTLAGGLAVETSGLVYDWNTNKVGIGTASPFGRMHIFSEAINNTPSAFSSNHFVVGRAIASGPSSGAVFIQYNSTGNVGLIGSLSPAEAWRPLYLAASRVSVSDASGIEKVTFTNTGNVSASGSLRVFGYVTSTGHIYPSANNAVDIGAYGYALRNVYASGTVYASSTIVGSGAQGAPPYTFLNDLDSGFYRIGAGDLAITTDGGAKLRFSGTAVTTYIKLIPNSNNSLDLGDYGAAWKNLFVSSTSYFGGAAGVDQLVVGSSTPYFKIDSSGRIGVGTASPQNTFDIANKFIVDSSGNVSASGTAQFLNTGTSTLKIDSSSGNKGACLELQDIDGQGYTYCYYLNGVQTCSQINCK